MTWGQRSVIPPRIKAQVRRRDKVCQLQHPGCTQTIEQFDHPQGLAAQGKQRETVRSAAEVQGVCVHCHTIKTEQQRRAGIEAAKARRGSLSRRYRDREPHPGSIRGEA